MIRFCPLALLLLALQLAQAASLDEVRAALRTFSLDPAQTYRVRDLQFSRGGVKIYLTEGILAFAQPINGRCVAAVFTTDGVDAGDAEVLTFPPDRAERASLASFTGSPNLDEHFNSAILFFGDNTAGELQTQIHEHPLHPLPETAASLMKSGETALRTSAAQLDVRLAATLLDQHRPEHGFFYAMIGGRDKRAFDFAYQPDQPDTVTFGRLAPKADGGGSYFQIWSAFRPRGLPEAARPGNNLSDYRIEATIHPDLSMSAAARFGYAPNEGDGRVIPLLMSSRLQIRSASVDGAAAEFYQHAATPLENRGGATPFIIVAPEALASGSHHQLEVRYQGSVIHKTQQGNYFVDDRSAWYPFLSPSRATFDLIFHCPETLRLAATGEPVSDEVAAGVRTVHRRTVTPQALAGFNVGEYAVNASTHGAYQIEVYSNKGPLQSADIAAQTADILDRFTRLWGTLPLHNLAVSPIEGYFGQGFPGLIYLSNISYTLEQDRPASLRNPRLDSFFTQILLPHEVAHQWWGNIVTPAGYRSNWILEALANYVALQYLEAVRGKSALEELLMGYRVELLATRNGQTSESHGPVVFGERLLDNYGTGIWHDVIYEKGAWIFHMLRRRLGDDAFAELQRRLLRDYADKAISNEDLRKAAAALAPVTGSDKSLEAFFDTWVYGTGIPTLSIDSGQLLVSGVDQDYLADIPIVCRANGVKQVTRWVHASSGSTPLPRGSCQLPRQEDFLYE